MTYTGNEPINVTFFSDGTMNSEGETIYGKTLREFMRALLSDKEFTPELRDEDMIENINGNYGKSPNGYYYETYAFGDICSQDTSKNLT